MTNTGTPPSGNVSPSSGTAAAASATAPANAPTMASQGAAAAAGPTMATGKMKAPPPPPIMTMLPPTPAGNVNPGAMRVYQPPNPTMGGLLRTGDTDYTPWTGGKPNNNWSGLEAPPATVHPTMLRPTTAGSSQKSQAYRTAGLTTKFGHSGDVLEFQKETIKHFERYGMDTITYVHDPADRRNMVSIIHHHTKFTMDEAVAAGALVYPSYDGYDLANVEDAKIFVENSLEKELAKELNQVTKDVTTFVEYWMRLIEIVHVPGTDHFENIKARMRKRSIKDHSGEDVVALCQDYTNDYDELHDAGLYDHNLTLVAIKAIMEGGGTSNEDFRSELRTIRNSLDQKLLEVRYLSYEESHRRMVASGLHLPGVLRQCKAQYRKVLGDGKWPAANHAKDSKALNKSYGSVNKAQESTDVSAIEKLVNQLVRKMDGDGMSKLTCYNCGKKGHMARDCRSKKTPNGGANNQRGRGKSTPNPKKDKSRGRRGKGSEAPKTGEPEIKYIDGVKKYWCARCNRWTLNHGTDNHKTKEEMKQESNNHAKIARVDFDFHPTIYKAVDSGVGKGPISRAPAQLPIIDMLLYGFWIGLMLNLLTGIFQSESAIQVCNTAFVWFGQAITIAWTALLQFAGNNWITYLHAAIGGTVSAYTAYKLYQSAPIEREEEDKPSVKYRVRRGPNFQKKLRRANRIHVTKRGTKRRMTAVDIPMDWNQRSLLTAHDKYSHIGRHHRTELPIDRIIRMLASEIDVLEKDIQHLKRQLALREQRLANRKHQLKLAKGRKREQLRAEFTNQRVQSTLERTNMSTLYRMAEDLKERNYGCASCAKTVHKKHPIKRRMDVYTKNNAKYVRELLQETHKGPVPTAQVTARKQRTGINVASSQFHPVKVDWNSQPRTQWHVHMAQLNDRNKTSSTRVAKVLFDTGANCCITHDRNDFVGEYTPVQGKTVDGIGKGLSIKGKGHVAWTFKADNGMYRTLKLPCYYIPDTIDRIASVSVLLQCYPDETVNMSSGEFTLSGNAKEGRPSVTIPMCSKTNLPFASVAKDATTPCVNHIASGPPLARKKGQLNKPVSSLTAPENSNITESEKELLRWHYKLGHIGMKRVQWLLRQGILCGSERQRRLHTAASQLTCGPMCTACQYAKQRRKTEPGTQKRTDKASVNALKRDQLFPGQRVSVDHFHASVRGRRLDTYGKEAENQRYVGGAIFVDHASGHIYVALQSHLNSHETLKAKEDFEAMCKDYGVIIQEYLSDNGTAFRNVDFTAALKAYHQHLKNAAVGAHHSNGIAERAISTVMSLARAMMHHAALHWPDVSDTALWPLAVLHAVHLINNIPREDNGLSPLEIFSRQSKPHSKLQDCHVWGCPVYVLDHRLANGKKIPRWSPRSSRCVYVGESPQHTGSAARVLSLETGKISTQYHAIFDDWFQTVDTKEEDLPDFDQDEWYRLFGTTEWQYVPDDDKDVPVPEPPNGYYERAAKRQEDVALAHEEQREQKPPQQREQESTPQRESSTPPLSATKPPASPSQAPPTEYGSAPEAALPPVASLQREESTEGTATIRPPSQAPSNVGWFDVEYSPPKPTATVSTATPPTATASKRAPPVVQNSNGTQVQRKPKPTSAWTTVTRSSRRLAKLEPEYPMMIKRIASEDDHWENLFVYLCMTRAADPELLKASAAKQKRDPDTYNYDEAMASPYKTQFLKAADVELEELGTKGTWVEDLLKNAKSKVIPSQWVFRIKRSPDGEIRKFKARLVLRGDLQEYEGKTFSPVAAWSTVRSFVVSTEYLGWVSITIDFSNAFVQSYLPKGEEVWMQVPRGYKLSSGQDSCLKLIKSLYGHKVAPLLWYQHISKIFKELGLKRSEHDLCLWYGENIMLVQYVDDCGIAAPNQQIIDEFIAKLKAKGLELTQESSFAEFLGIKFTHHPDGSIEMTQKGLIKKTLEAAGMTDCNPSHLPAPMNGLGSDKEGEPFQEKWNYRAIVGMLLYLATNTRIDIGFAVSQVARFGANPKQSHAKAVKQLLRYLKKTEDKGMIIKPQKNMELDLYVDADFCGLYKQEEDTDPMVARSRSGYVITLGGCPVIWKSSLQKCATLSTLEAEYVALSDALKNFLPIKRLLSEMLTRIGGHALDGATIRATVFEDNQGCYYLATRHQVTNRTRYFLARYHWFWEAYDQREFDVVKCPTDQQVADYLTKQLPRDKFEANRKSLQGW